MSSISQDVLDFMGQSQEVEVSNDSSNDAKTKGNTTVCMDNQSPQVKQENIPVEIKQQPQWVLWRKQERNGKITKVPYQANGSPARINDLSTWATHDDALQSFNNGGFDGIGFVFTGDDPYVGIDLDHCYDPGTERLEDWAQEIVDKMDSYTEITPSGQGLHVIIKGSLPSGHNRKGGIELYDQGRYFTVTGNRLKGQSLSIQERTTELNGLFQQLFDDDSASLPATICAEKMSDEDLIARAKSAKNGSLFQRLYAGDITGYGSASEADSALCCILAFWTQSLNQIDRIFRQSKLYREKWEREDYRRQTIQNALAHTNAHYNDSQEKNTPNTESDESLPSGIGPLITDFELFHTKDEKAYATISEKTCNKTYPVRSKKISSILHYRYFNKYKKSLSKQPLQDAIDLLEAKGLYEGTQSEVYTRIAENHGTIYVDLANACGEVVSITSSGWDITKNEIIRFLQPSGMLPLPTPRRGGSVKSLKKFINLEKDDDLVLLVSWILEAFRLNTPKPILNLQGEHGSAKSTATRVVRSLIDPVNNPLRAFPKNERDLIISVQHQGILAFDNLSNLSLENSDSLCRLSTGGGFSTRKLYTDDEEIQFNVLCPVILNGIVDFAHQPDLIDRMLNIHLPPINDTQRIEETVFWEKFNRESPLILGAIFDALSVALKNINKVQLPRKPRMVDFACLATAAEPALECAPGRFLEIYERNQANAIEKVLEEDPIASAIVKLMETRLTWEGIAQDLLIELGGYVPERIQRTKSWPDYPRTLSNRIRRLIPSLRKIGIDVTPPNDTEWNATTKKSQRLFEITKNTQNTVSTVCSVMDPETTDAHDANHGSLNKTPIQLSLFSMLEETDPPPDPPKDVINEPRRRIVI